MKELKAYYRQVATWLPCGGRLKKQLMERITATVDGYLAEHPEADFAALQARFGTPQQIASAFVDEMETDELLNALRTRRRIVKIVLICAATAVAIWAIAVLSLWIIGLDNTLGYGVMYPPRWE